MRTLVIAAVLFAVIAFSAFAQADDEVVTLSPIAGVTLGVPKGWKACDEATDKLLGSADDPMMIKDKLCAAVKANAEVKFGVFNPKVGYTASVLFLYLEQAPLTQEVIQGLSEAMLTQIRDAVQKDWDERITKVGGKLDSITVRSDKIAGFTALVSTIIQSPAGGALGQSVTETWEIPAGGKLYQFNFTWSKALESNTKPDVDAIKASIKIEPPGAK